MKITWFAGVTIPVAAVLVAVVAGVSAQVPEAIVRVTRSGAVLSAGQRTTAAGWVTSAAPGVALNSVVSLTYKQSTGGLDKELCYRIAYGKTALFADLMAGRAPRSSEGSRVECVSSLGIAAGERNAVGTMIGQLYSGTPTAKVETFALAVDDARNVLSTVVYVDSLDEDEAWTLQQAGAALTPAGKTGP